MAERKRELSDAGKRYQATVSQRYGGGHYAQHGSASRASGSASGSATKPRSGRLGVLAFVVTSLIVVAFVSSLLGNGSSPKAAAADAAATANTTVASAGASKYSSTYESSAYGSHSTGGTSSARGSSSKYGSSPSTDSRSSKGTSSSNDFRIVESGYDDANGKGYKGSDGNYYFKNYDGSVEATDGFGNGVKDVNGDGKADYYTTDSGDTWKRM